MREEQASATPTNQLAALDQLDLRSMSVGEGLTIVGTLLRNRYYDDHRYSIEARACFDGFEHARPAAGGAGVQAARR